MTRLLIPLALLLALAVLLGCTADPPFQHDVSGTARPDGLLLAAYHRPPPPVYGARTGTRVPMAAPTTTTVTVTSTTVTSRPPRPAMWQPPNPGRTIACVVARESGGQPQTWNRAHTNWGVFQFDLPTWLTYGGSRSSFGNAPAAAQWVVFGRAVAAGDLYHGWLEWDGCR